MLFPLWMKSQKPHHKFGRNTFKMLALGRLAWCTLFDKIWDALKANYFERRVASPRAHENLRQSWRQNKNCPWDVRLHIYPTKRNMGAAAAAVPLHQKGKRSCSPSISPSFRAKEGHSLLLQQKYLVLPTLGMLPVSHYNIKNTPTHSTPQ